MIQNQEYVIKKSEFKSIAELPEILAARVEGDILRWYITRVTPDKIHIETTRCELRENDLSTGEVTGAVFPGKSVVVSVIPTGVGCNIGGYAADAGPVTQLLASCCDYLITNPNAVNASNFISIENNILYTEGFMIDWFCRGSVNLYTRCANKVGLIIEKTVKENLEIIFNIVNAVRAVHGINIVDYVITDEPIGGRCVRSRSGAYVGKIENPPALFKACDYLKGKGVEAVAVTTNIEELPRKNYALHFAGQHPNPVGGAEAIISHLICRNYKIPAAHAPMINFKEMQLDDNIVDARGAGEFSSVSGLACVLIGLNNAPQISKDNKYGIKDALNINNLTAVIAPASALGGIPMLYAEKFAIPIIAVEDNKTILEVTQEALNLNHVIKVRNYAEAAGIIQALRKGIFISSLYRPLDTLRF